ncbi:MAG TPA: TPM domain-containing protein [Longimicrobiales bacterium]|nr:TPM domain-containing protein [Longimicrobiales bacterium]
MAWRRNAAGRPRPLAGGGRARRRAAALAPRLAPAAALALLLSLAPALRAQAPQAPPAPAAARPDATAPRPDSAAAPDSAALADSLAAVVLPGATFPDRPADGVYHLDEAGVIDEGEARQLDRIGEALLRDEHVPMLVVTLKDLASHGAAGQPIERYAAALFQDWRMGTAEREVGILLLVSVGDRRARIELGAGWGRSYDRAAVQVMNTLILPLFRDGRYSDGVLAGVRGLDAMARGRPLPAPPTPWWQWPLAGAIFLGVSAIVYSVINSGRYGWAYSIAAGLVGLVLLLLTVRREGHHARGDARPGEPLEPAGAGGGAPGRGAAAKR